MSSHARPSEGHIDQLLQSQREIHAPEYLKREARLKDYESEYKRSVEDPGGIAVPAEIVFPEKLPKTRSGKIMRRLLKAQELGRDVGDISTLEE